MDLASKARLGRITALKIKAARDASADTGPDA